MALHLIFFEEVYATNLGIAAFSAIKLEYKLT